ncbi:MAG: SCO family protein [Candidatus Thiodiazotropha sp. (ex Dulcina madagascariensis)]|nr:SCO family protein [Candidatus Thiodiazotropha sp. (ex Dulcina madagascariensis)]
MQRRLLFIVIGLLGGLLIWMLLVWRPVAEEGSEALGQRLSAPPKGGEFSLVSYRGPVRLSDFHGKVVLLYFGYTWCPDICPTNLAMMSAALNEMRAEELAGVQGIFISVDPRRDTPQRLKEYVEYFHPQLLGVTGSTAEIAATAGHYGAAYRPVKEDVEGQYAVDHTADTYIIDRQGKLVVALPHGSGVEALLAVVRSLL